jgi:hypothetical protein
MSQTGSIGCEVPKGLSTELSPGHHASLFGIIARNAVECAGDEGRLAIIEAVKVYGLQRGRRMRKRALRNGDKTNMTAYRAYSEWKAPQGSVQSEIVERSPVLVIRILSCPWNDAWQKNNLTELGHYYCDNIDRYLAMGFDESLKLEVEQTFSGCGLEYCEFAWHGIDFTEENERLTLEMRNRLGESCIKDWLYHIRHLTHVLSDTLIKRLANADIIMQKSKDDFLKLFGDQFSFIFDGPDLTDYDEIL